MANRQGAGTAKGGFGVTSPKEVLRRMREGQKLTLTWGPACQSIFEDGSLVRHEVMLKLVEKGLARPAGDRVGDPWILAQHRV